MTRIVNFADGFTSASAPITSGGIQEDYLIANDQSVALLLTTLDKDVFQTAFINYELKRKTDINSFTQGGDLTMIYDGSNWVITEGLTSLNSMIRVDAIENPEDVQLILNPTTGDLSYKSGLIPGSTYIGTLKLNIVRISL